MSEEVILPSPTTVTRTLWQLKSVTIDVREKLISVTLLDNNGKDFGVLYPTPSPVGSTQPSGQTLLSTLNTSNNTTTSLVKRIFNRLISDGYISGTVSGTPE